MAIDANNSRFRHLLTAEDWRLPDASSELQWDARSGALTLREIAYEFPAPNNDQPLAVDSRRGAGRDRYGNVFWVNADRDGIRMADVEGRVSDWWPPPADARPAPAAGAFGPVVASPAAAPWRLRGLCITGEHYMLVGVDRDPADSWSGLLLFDLHAGGVASELRWPGNVRFSPRDLSAAADGGAWVLDAEDDGRLWRLNRVMQVCMLDPAAGTTEQFPARRLDFLPSDGAMSADLPRQLFPSPWPLRDTQGRPLNGAIAIEALFDDDVLVLDSAHSAEENARVVWLSLPAGATATVRESALDVSAVHPSVATRNPLHAHDCAYVPAPGGRWGRLYTVTTAGNQVYAFEAEISNNGRDFRLIPKVDYYPLFGHSGRQLITAGPQLAPRAGDAGQVDAISAMYTDVYYDHGERWLPLVAQRKPSFETSGVLVSRALDGETHDCVWHRLVLDADIPAETAVRIESRSANEVDELDALPWRAEPAPYRRAIGSELPGHEAFRHDGCAPAKAAGSWELLLQAAEGRYLQLRVSLAGNGRRTPRVRSLRAWFPRFSYLREYLPAVYREDSDAASFLDRYLANVEGLFTTWEDRIAAAQLLLDAQTAPAEFLDWLAGWLGLSLDPTWDTERRRLLLRYASRLFRQRGTAAGMVRSLRLALDDCPDERLFEQDVIDGVQPVRVVERFSQRAPARVDLKAVATESVTGNGSGVYPRVDALRGYLAKAWATWLEAFPTELVDAPDFPLTQPGDSSAAAIWRRFLREELDFEYAVVDRANGDDQRAWQRFLLHRHGRLERVAALYGLTATTAVALGMPETLGTAGARFDDWIRFVSAYLPAHRAAHRFTVLVPTPASLDAADLAAWFARVQAVVRHSMPAHTAFEVQLYSGLCRVGVARLGLDTVLEKGARASAYAIGGAVLGDARLAASYPNDLTDRRVLASSGGCAST